MGWPKVGSRGRVEVSAAQVVNMSAQSFDRTNFLRQSIPCALTHIEGLFIADAFVLGPELIMKGRRSA